MKCESIVNGGDLVIRTAWGHGDAFSEQPCGILCMQLTLSVSTQPAPIYLTTCPPSLSGYSINSARVRAVALPVHPRLACHLPYSTLIQHLQVSGLLPGSLGSETELAWPFMGRAECVNFRASRAINDVGDQSQ